jgi:hypothetical protein
MWEEDVLSNAHSAPPAVFSLKLTGLNLPMSIMHEMNLAKLH